MDEKQYLGVGLYSYADAARIIGVPPSTLRSWVRDYFYDARGRPYRRKPVIRRYFPDEPILTFLELIELLFVKLFRDHGVSMPTIRLASARAAQMFNHDYPFAVQRFDTDGQRIFATLKDEADDATLVQELARGQLAFDRFVRPFFRKLEYEGSMLALTYWPLERTGRIVLDPRRNFGQPIDADTGVPTRVLYNALVGGAGRTAEQVADWYEVPVAAVEAAIAYEAFLHAQ